MLSSKTQRKFIETYPGNGRKVLTPLGYKEIEFIHKTIPYSKYRIKTESGLTLNCAENHVIILSDDTECYAKDSLNKQVKTINGTERIVECEEYGYKESMYDISIKEDTELYYSNGILSHNSGKSVSTGVYLTWKFNFDHDKNIGICANNIHLALEFLNNVRDMFYGMPMWMRVGVSVWNKSTVRSENNIRILTSSPSKNAFRGFTLSILVVDEAAFIKSSIYKEFIDSVAPSQSALAWKKNIFISTANGLNHFYEMVEESKSRKTYKNLSEEEKNEKVAQFKEIVLETKQLSDGTFDVVIDKPANGMLFYEVDWKNVPRYNSKGEQITPEEFKDEVVSKYGEVYFEQNYGNKFLGSSYTLIEAKILETMSPFEPCCVWDNKLNIIKEPEENHRYIMGVDPAKGGLDAFAVQVIDVTNFPFEQVAVAQIFKCNYQIMPDFIYEWATSYNNAFVIVENNEGAGTFVANMLKTEYEYENLYYKPEDKKRKEPGFRTTSRTRNQILETFKSFVDNKRLIVKDKETITELYSFIIIDNKYQADDGCHDDLIMALCLCFVPFINSKNFEDMKTLIKELYSDREDISDINFSDFLIVGNFDDGSELNISLAGQKFDSEFEYSTDFYSKNPLYKNVMIDFDEDKFH